MYDREPPLLLAVTVGLGGCAMSLAGRIEVWTFELAGLDSLPALAGVAAIQEELLKVLVVLLIAHAARRQFNDPMDGLIYGSLTGLGMAVEESVAIQGGRAFASGQALPPAELVRLCGHLVMGGIGGLPVGMARMRTRGWRMALVLCPAFAIALHFSWDWLALSAPPEAWTEGRIATGVALMLAGLLVYGTLVALASEWSHQLFAPDRPSHLWGWPLNRLGFGSRRKDAA